MLIVASVDCYFFECLLCLYFAIGMTCRYTGDFPNPDYFQKKLQTHCSERSEAEPGSNGGPKARSCDLGAKRSGIGTAKVKKKC